MTVQQRDNSDRIRAVVPTRLLAAQPDALLCRLAARGNVGAFSALYERHRLPLVAYVYHLLGRGGSAEDAEDIAQDTFARAFSALGEKRPDGSFRPWLHTIARNRTFDHLRARREAVVSLDREEAEPPPAPAGDQPAERAEQCDELAWLLTAVATIPERQRDALLLKEMGGLSHEHIAGELGTTVSATKKLIGRARDHLDAAAVASGHRRGRRLGNNLTLVAPVLPLSVSLASLGVGAGTAGAGGTGVGTAGKVAATILVAASIGGGTVAVERHRSAAHDIASAADGVRAVGGMTPSDATIAPRLPATPPEPDRTATDEKTRERRENVREGREDAREDRREAREERREAREEAREARREAREDAADRAEERREATRPSEREERDSDSDDDSDDD